MENKDKIVFNPFHGRDRDQVWKEIRENAKPTTREEAFRKMKEISEAQKKNK
jgi:hypothetical protein